MILRYAFTRADGGVSIVTAMPKEHLAAVLGEISDAEYRQHVINRSIPPDARNVVELPGDWEPPAERAFRNAWVLERGAVIVDMAMARDIHRDHLRALREPKLRALDVEYQRADETGDAQKKARIAKEKQKLRDVTKDHAIEAANTPSELATVIPETLR